VGVKGRFGSGGEEGKKKGIIVWVDYIQNGGGEEDRGGRGILGKREGGVVSHDEPGS